MKEYRNRIITDITQLTACTVYKNLSEKSIRAREAHLVSLVRKAAEEHAASVPPYTPAYAPCTMLVTHPDEKQIAEITRNSLLELKKQLDETPCEKSVQAMYRCIRNITMCALGATGAGNIMSWLKWQSAVQKN